MHRSKSKLNLSGYLRTNKGGISNLVFEVIMSVIILSLLVVVIYIFRNNMDLISSSADRVNDTDKIKADSMLCLDQDNETVKGSEVISVIRFYSTDNTVQIEITVGNLSKSYIAEDYDPLIFPINFDDNYEFNYEYEGSAIKKITYKKL